MDEATALGIQLDRFAALAVMDVFVGEAVDRLLVGGVVRSLDPDRIRDSKPYWIIC